MKFYYVSKKGENFKQLARKASLKRKKAFVKSDMLTLTHPLATPPHSMLMDSKPVSLPDIKPPSGERVVEECMCISVYV